MFLTCILSVRPVNLFENRIEEVLLGLTAIFHYLNHVGTLFICFLKFDCNRGIERY